MLDFERMVFPEYIQALVVESEDDMKSIDADFDNTICYFLVSGISSAYNFGTSSDLDVNGRYTLLLMRYDTDQELL